MGLQRILVPFEGGPLSVDALELACDLAGEGGSVSTVYVVRTPPHLPIGAEDTAVALGEEIIRRVAEVGRSRKVRVDTKVVKAADVAEGIVAAAREMDTDAIVMSHRHKHALGETMVLSHTASRVLITYRQGS